MLEKMFPVMLPAIKKPYPIEQWGAWLFLTTHGVYSNREPKAIGQHLYICSKTEIKEGDWVYCSWSHPDRYIYKVKSIRTSIKDVNGFEHPVKYSLKIEATTDKSLGLPDIPLSFIKHFIEVNGNIKEVTVVNGNIKEVTVVNGLLRRDNTIVISVSGWDAVYHDCMKEIGCRSIDEVFEWLKVNYKSPQKI